MITSNADEVLIDLRTAADRLSVGYSTIRLWASQNRFPVYHVGSRAVRVRMSEVEAGIITTTKSSRQD